MPNSKCDKANREGRAILENHRQVWAQKPALRAIYRKWYGEMLSCLAFSKHPTVELGGGTGNLKEFCPQIITADIIPCEWLDLVCDAHFLPFKAGRVGNLLLFDVLHHLTSPLCFFKEAARFLEPGGRMVMLEPYISPFSWLCYSVFHHEEVRREAEPLNPAVENTSSPTFLEGNSAIPTLIFGKFRKELEHQVPMLRIVMFRRLSFLAYPLSGGFKEWSLLSPRWFPLVNKIERSLAFLLPLLAFRCLIVLEKAGKEATHDQTMRR